MPSMNSSGGCEINREELQAAIAKAVELRALHASLTTGSNSSPACSLRLPPGASPCLSRLSGEDYPVFAPSYEGEPLPGHRFLRSDNRTLSETWGGSVINGESREDELDHYSGIIMDKHKSPSMNREHQICLADDQKSNSSSCRNHISALQISPANVFRSSRRTDSLEFKSISTCNKCKPASINREADCDGRNHRASMGSLSVAETQASIQLPPKSRSPILSWLFPRSKKKSKSDMSPNTIESEDMTQLFKDWGMQTLDSLKKELAEANENRDVALAEAQEMKSTLGELKDKMVQLETYCEELKKALKQAVQANEAPVNERRNLSRRTKLIGGGKESSMPVSHEVMVEGFLQIVSEARLSVKQFCKTLVSQIGKTDDELSDKLNLLLETYNLSTNSMFSRGVLYHLEALINQSLYQDFENCVFQKNGSPKSLDPHRDRQDNFSAFVALRNLSWNEVLRKGTKYYSEDFSKFCDQKMSSIAALLDWSRLWPEQLLQSFFVAAKCIWLLHLLAFSFETPLTILRVEESRSFNAQYMEDVLVGRHRTQTPAKVKIMVMPGFYVHDTVLKCKVLCRYRSMS